MSFKIRDSYVQIRDSYDQFNISFLKKIPLLDRIGVHADTKKVLPKVSPSYSSNNCLDVMQFRIVNKHASPLIKLHSLKSSRNIHIYVVSRYDLH